jgi:uncharacterized protein YqgC (DUF456 family)
MIITQGQKSLKLFNLISQSERYILSYVDSRAGGGHAGQWSKLWSGIGLLGIFLLPAQLLVQPELSGQAAQLWRGKQSKGFRSSQCWTDIWLSHLTMAA